MRTFVLSAAACLLVPGVVLAQARKQQASTVTNSCRACLNAFSPTDLIFTSSNADKCPKLLAGCFKGNLAPKCEGVAKDCIAANCEAAGSCSDETSNRGLIHDCMKASSIFMPYQCAGTIKGFASSKAMEARAALQAAQNAQEASIAAQQAQAEAQKAAAQQAQAEAQVKSAQAAADAQVRAAQEQAAAQQKLEQQKFENEQKAKLAELERQKQAELDRRNSKPNVKYNNIIAEAKKELGAARTYVNKASTLLGITKTSEQPSSGNAMYFPAPIVKVDPISFGKDAKSVSLSSGSKYKTAQNFKCTKDAKESFIKTQLLNAYETLAKGREKLSASISELEALNADDEQAGKIAESKITTLYQVLNRMTDSMNVAEAAAAGLTTSCETRCEGMSSMKSSGSSGAINFDDDGNIIDEETAADGGYSCKELEAASSSGGFSIANIFSSSGSISANKIMGGTGRQVIEITTRALKAVLEVDRSLDSTEIAINSGNFDVGTGVGDYALINDCLKYTITDMTQYTLCAQDAISQMFTHLSKNPSDEYVKSELTQGFVSVLDILNGDMYRAHSQCEGVIGNKDTQLSGKPENLEDCKKEHKIWDYNTNTCYAFGGQDADKPCCTYEYPSNSGTLYVDYTDGLNSARQCSINLASRLQKVRDWIENEEEEKKNKRKNGGNARSGSSSRGVQIKGFFYKGQELWISFLESSQLNTASLETFIGVYCSGAELGSDITDTKGEITGAEIIRNDRKHNVSIGDLLPDLCYDDH